MKCQTATLLMCLACAYGAGADISASVRALTRSMPDWETRILCEVAKEYDLSANELKLLLTIRRIENGRPGREMGVGANYPMHPARRFARNPVRSLRVQARWTAGTIRLHYTGNIETFAKKYCPYEWRRWSRMARHWMSQQAAGDARGGNHKLRTARQVALLQKSGNSGR